MVFTHDTDVSLQAAVSLANSARQPDSLRTMADADAFYEAYAYTGRHDRTQTELDDLRDVRAVLRRLLLAERDEAAAQVNAVLAEATAVPQLVRHDEWDWHLHAVSPDLPWVQRILIETAMAMVDVVRADETSRLGTCASDGCDNVTLDLSRNRSRRFCSTACGNREAVAAHRARRAAG